MSIGVILCDIIRTLCELWVADPTGLENAGISRISTASFQMAELVEFSARID